MTTTITMDGVRVIEIVCSQCVGKGTVEIYTPHVRESKTVKCPQCNGKRSIKVCAPDEERKAEA